VEFSFYSPIDHLFHGVMTAAAHNEKGETLFELHEAYISSSKLIPRSRLKLGQFFLGIGRLNRTHRHDWQFTVAPKVHAEFFDEEGVMDSGLEYSYLLPTSFYLDVTVGLTTGHVFGHSHSAGSRPEAPTHYARMESFFSLSDNSGLSTGLNFLKRTDSNSEEMQLYGLDVLYKVKENRKVSLLVQSEIWFRNLKPKANEASETLGAYIFSQYGLNENLSFGFRLDAYSVLSKKNSVSKEKISNIDYTVSPQITYRASEFSRFRLTYFKQQQEEDNIKQSSDEGLYLQFVYILGAHPSHDF
jgi:hypothetical protein